MVWSLLLSLLNLLTNSALFRTISPSQPRSANQSQPDSPEIRPTTSRRKSGFDIDDDWDANVEHDLVRVRSIQKSFENKPIPDYKRTNKIYHRHSSSSTHSSPSRHPYDSSRDLRSTNNSSSNLPHSNNHSPTSNSLSTSHLVNGSRLSGTDTKDTKNNSDLYGSPSSSTRNDGLKVQYDRILKDPSNSLNTIDLTPSADSLDDIKRISRIHKFKKVLHSSNVDLEELKKLAWSGVPYELRPITWQLLLGYLPTNAERRLTTLSRKRKDYLDGVEQAFSSGLDHAMWHQISIDVPRTNPHIELYGYHTTQRALERILYLWAIRHPASGYVQGINDLVTPFFQTFLSAFIEVDPEKYDPGNLPKEVLDVVEADTFWCLTKLLDGIQDNYIHAQPGIQRQVAELRELTQRIDSNLVKHLSSESVEFMQFSFRWMNCLLMREVSVKNTIRMWDTYIAEGANGFSEFHVYVCAAFLVKWSSQIQEMDFQEIMMFLQALPTKEWGEKDIELLLSEAYMWQSLFKNASAHLR